MAQHALGVVAGRLLLDHGRLAHGMQACDQHGRLDLRRGDRRRILDGHQIRCAAHGQRQGVATFLLDLEAHLDERLQHAAHRPARQRGVADEPDAHVVAGHHAHHQPEPGTGVAVVDVPRGSDEATDATAQDLPHRPILTDRAAERLQSLRRVQHVLAFEQATNVGAPCRQRSEHQRAVRDGLIAGHPHAPGKRPRPGGGKRR